MKNIALIISSFIALLCDVALAATIDTASLPTSVDTALKAIGFAGLMTWVVGIIALIASVAAVFATARIIYRCGSMIAEGKTWDEIEHDRALDAHFAELEKSSGGGGDMDLNNPQFEYETSK